MSENLSNDITITLLEYLRRKKGITQTELGRRVGTFQHQVSRWEKATNIPNTKNCLALVKEFEKFGVTHAEELFQDCRGWKPAGSE